MRSILIHLVMVLSNSSSGGLTGFMCLVQKSIAEIVGSYSKWVFSFQEAIVPLLLFLASGLARPVAASAYANALRRICEDAFQILVEPSKLEVLVWKRRNA